MLCCPLGGEHELDQTTNQVPGGSIWIGCGCRPSVGRWRERGCCQRAAAAGDLFKACVHGCTRLMRSVRLRRICSIPGTPGCYLPRPSTHSLYSSMPPMWVGCIVLENCHFRRLVMSIACAPATKKPDYRYVAAPITTSMIGISLCRRTWRTPIVKWISRRFPRKIRSGIRSITDVPALPLR
jgi:hypothetical protein